MRRASGRGLSRAASRNSKARFLRCRSSTRSTVDAAGRVVFSATVELEDQNSGDVVKYQIVGDDEADIKAGWISVSSPIARALIGKSEGDIAT